MEDLLIEKTSMTKVFDIEKIRSDFPILSRKVNGKKLVYFDNSATTQKPQVVIDAERYFYEYQNSNIHRGVHFLSGQATEMYENARRTVQNFINARCRKEIIFTSGATESINLVAFTYGETFINQGDEIIVSEMEHHSNIVPWQIVAERKGAKIVVLPFNFTGELEVEKLEGLINERTKLVACTHISNALATVNPVKRIVEIAHSRNVPVLIDGAQAIQHTPIDVQDLDCDFYVFSAHKMYAPTGIGVLYGKEEWLEKLPPYKSGGDMIAKVTFAKTTYNQLPLKFEAGTPNYTGAICLSKAIDYINEIGVKNIAAYEAGLLKHARTQLQNIDGLTIYGNAPEVAGCVSFLVGSIHYYDLGMIVDKLGIAVRTGTHCAQPVVDKFGITGTVRASFALYNTIEEIDILVDAIKKVKVMFE